MHPIRDRKSASATGSAPPKEALDLSLRRAIELRREQQLATLTEPEFPASGTELVSARLAEARARQGIAPLPR